DLRAERPTAPGRGEPDRRGDLACVRSEVSDLRLRRLREVLIMAPKTAEYRAENRRVISVDGEGQTVAGRHAYTLLAAADDRGFRKSIAHDGALRAGTGTVPYQVEDI